MSEKIEYVAPCVFGVEKLLSDEIEALGYEKTQAIEGRITFKGDIAAIPRCNTWLRHAERLYIKIGEFDASSFDELFDGTANLPWEQWIDQNDVFPVKGRSVKSRLESIPDCQRIVKKAVVTRLSSKYGIKTFRENGTKYQIVFFILNDKATLMIDSSGNALHKRGYRTEAAEAPLRETLAAAMVKMSRPRENVLLWDPFCGSGTIPIEAALLMTNTAPGLNRSFSAEHFPQVGKKTWRNARDEARDLQNLSVEFEAYASDIDKSCVETAKNNIARAKMEKFVKTFPRDALTIETEGRRGTIVCNPPYGERIFTKKQAENLYRDMGRHFSTLDMWQIYILTSLENFPSLYGRKPDKIRRLYNGMIKCGYYQFFKNPKKS